MKIKQLLFLGPLVFVGVVFNTFQPSKAHQPNEVSTNLNHEVNSRLSGFQEISPTLTPSNQQQIDDLLEAYKQALQYELENGETIEVADELGEKTIMLAGKSEEKIDALWQETIGKINELSARPSEERDAAVQLIRSIDESGDVIYLDRDRSLYNSGVELERYKTSKFIYSIDIENNQIVEISLVDQFNIDVTPKFSGEDLEKQAREFISLVAGKVDLNALTLSVGDKSGEIFFFRWEDQSALLSGGMPAFIQVGYSQSGELVNFVNTLLHVDQVSGTTTTVNFVVSPAFVFNEVYANGGAYWSWLSGTGTTQSNAGYCYYAGWCSPKNFYWKATCYGCTSAKGRWNANSSMAAVKAQAYVPSTHATTLQACYKTFYNGGASSYSYCINQNVLYNQWALLTPSLLYDIDKIDLANTQDSSSLKEIAWDETWVYKP